MYGLRENSVNENHALCRVITGHEHVYVCVCDRGRERETEREHGVLLYNAVEPVYVVLGRSLCDISGLTDVLIGKKKKKSLFKFGKSGIL